MISRSHGNIETAQELLDRLLEIKEIHGTLDVGISLFSQEHCDRFTISMVDIFTDGKDDHLHSIDLNF